MKRNVIQLAGKTHVISLPSKWVKKYSIKKGDELEISEEDSMLKVSCQGESTQKSISINLTGMNATLVWHTMLALYKEGYDEITAHFENEETEYEKTREKISVIRLLQEITDYCTGIEIIRHTKHGCVIREMSRIKPEEFEIMFRRIHYSITNLFEDGINAIKEGNYRLLDSISSHSEKSINRITCMCARAFSQSSAISPSMLVILYNLENMADSLDNAYSALPKNLRNKKEIIAILEEAKGIFEAYHQLFYKQDAGELDKTHRRIIRTLEKLDSAKEETNFTHNLITFMYYLTDAIEAGIPRTLLCKEQNP